MCRVKLWLPVSQSVCLNPVNMPPPSQVHWPLHQAACGKRWIARRWGEEKHRPSSWGHRQQDVPPLPWRSQVQAGYRHRPGNQTTWYVWEDHPGVGQHWTPCFVFYLIVTRTVFVLVEYSRTALSWWYMLIVFLSLCAERRQWPPCL